MAGLMRMCRPNLQKKASPHSARMNVAYRNQSYSRLAIVGGVALFVVLAYWDSFVSMFDLWQLSDHHHGTLVLPIAGFLIWRVRNRLSTTAVAPDKRGILIIAVLALGWLVARLIGIQVVEHTPSQ